MKNTKHFFGPYDHANFYGGPRQSPSLAELVDELADRPYSGDEDDGEEIEELNF